MVGTEGRSQHQPERDVRTVSGAGPHNGSDADDDRTAGTDGAGDPELLSRFVRKIIPILSRFLRKIIPISNR